MPVSASMSRTPSRSIQRCGEGQAILDAFAMRLRHVHISSLDEDGHHVRSPTRTSCSIQACSDSAGTCRGYSRRPQPSGGSRRVHRVACREGRPHDPAHPAGSPRHRVAFAATTQAFEGEGIPDSVSVCVFGSWARGELTSGSDHDWAILTAQGPRTSRTLRSLPPWKQSSVISAARTTRPDLSRYSESRSTCIRSCATSAWATTQTRTSPAGCCCCSSRLPSPVQRTPTDGKPCSTAT